MRVKSYREKQFFLLFMIVIILFTKVNCSASTNEMKFSDAYSKEPKNCTTMSKNIIDTSQCSKISKTQLKTLHRRGDDLVVQGEGYVFSIKGNEIVNYENEVETDIHLKRQKHGITFCVNNGNNLCAPLYVRIDSIHGKYLYLYNEAKDKYEYIKANDLDTIKITTPGKYLITDKQIRSVESFNNWIVWSGIIFVLIGTALYVITRKRYWFW